MPALLHDRETLHQGGYLIVPNFFSEEEISRVHRAQDAYYRGESNQAPDFAWPHPRPCSVRSRKHPYASFFRSEISTLLRDGRLATLLKDIFDLQGIRFWHDQLLYEEPRPPGPLKYHWHREESRWRTCAAQKMMTAWIPLINFTSEMGPITMMPADKPIRMVLKTGDLVVFDATTLHGNPPNFGRQARRALAAHFASDDLQYRQAGNFRHVNERLVQKKDGFPNFQDPSVCPLIA